MVNSAGSAGAPGPGGTAWEGRATPLRIGGPLAPLSVRHLAFEPQVTATQNAPARCTEVGSPGIARDLSPIRPPGTGPAPPRPSPTPPPIPGQAPTLRRVSAPRQVPPHPPQVPPSPAPPPAGSAPPPGSPLRAPPPAVSPPGPPGHGARGGARAAAPGHLHRRHHRHAERARR